MRKNLKYFKIGEVSRIKNITIKALRFYDRVGLLTPAMVDAYSGYRYYSADQLFQVEMIQYLRNLNIPIADMKYLFSTPTCTPGTISLTSCRR